GPSEGAPGVLQEEAVDARRRAVEDQGYRVVARGPRVLEEPARARLELRGEHVAEGVERLAERRAPALIPPRVPARAAAAARAPPLDPARAAPRGAVDHLDLVRRRVALEELAVAREPREPLLLHPVERVGERHVAVAVVVAVGLAVGRDVDELGLVARVRE